MKRMTPLVLFLLCACACTKMEVTLPSCENIEATRENTFLHLKIHSSSDFVTITSDLGYSKSIINPYFGCVTINTDFGEVFTIEDDGRICTITLDAVVR